MILNQERAETVGSIWHGWNSCDASKSGVLAISWYKKFSKTCISDFF